MNAKPDDELPPRGRCLQIYKPAGIPGVGVRLAVQARAIEAPLQSDSQASRCLLLFRGTMHGARLRRARHSRCLTACLRAARLPPTETAEAAARSMADRPEASEPIEIARNSWPRTPRGRGSPPRPYHEACSSPCVCARATGAVLEVRRERRELRARVWQQRGMASVGAEGRRANSAGRAAALALHGRRRCAQACCPVGSRRRIQNSSPDGPTP